MISKRIFIAVGSESLKGVTALVKRLCEENLFSKFNDRYIAIDSAAAEIAEFNALGERLNTDRIKGFVLNIGDEDDEVTKTFQPGWVHRDIPAGGVGGDRTISAKAVDFIKNIWFNNDLQLGNSLRPNDQIVIVGSAFGGTSGGLFPNICDFIDLQILRKRIDDTRFKDVEVLGFLMMPEALPSSENYPIAVNMISMFKDLQMASWRRRLESQRKGFKVPVWAQMEKEHGRNHFPVFTRTRDEGKLLNERGVSGSTLPVSTMYIVPTPSGNRAYTISLLAEQLFAATYLHVDKGHEYWINRVNQGVAGPSQQLSAEDPCFAGFNMFVMKSGRMISLKNWFYKSMIGVLEGEKGNAGFLNGSDRNPIIPGNIKEVFLQVQMTDRDTPLSIAEKDYSPSLRDLLEQESDALKAPRKLQNLESNFGDMLEAVRAEAKVYDIKPAKEMMAVLSCSCFSDWNKDINIGLIQKGYEAFHADVMSQKELVGEYAEQLKTALHKTIKLANERVKNRVVRNSPFGLAQEDSVFKEITAAFDVKFKTLLKSYIYACRCEHSPFIGPDVFAGEVEEFKQTCIAIKNMLKKKCADLRGGSNPYIVDGKLIEPLAELPDAQKEALGFDPFKVTMAVAYRASVSDSKLIKTTHNDMVELLKDDALLYGKEDKAYDFIMDFAEEKVVGDYIGITENLQPGVNPLSSATLEDFAEVYNKIDCKPHADAFRLEDSGNYHYHFVVKQGDIPATFRLTNSDVVDRLGFGTMPNTANGASAFLMETHKEKMAEKNFWKDESMDIFDGRKDRTEHLHVQGLWLGTLGINFQVHDVLDRLYRKVEHVKFAWGDEERRVRSARSTMTLSEMVRFGIVIESLETKINEAWKAHKAMPGMANDNVKDCANVLRIAFERDGRKYELPEATLHDFGFKDNDDGTCQLRYLTIEWVGALLKWIRSTDASGFKSFYPQIRFDSIRNCETDIFSKMRFSITPDEVQEMDILKTAIMNTINITGL